MRQTAAILFLIFSAAAARAGESRLPHECMSASEIREAVVAHKLVQPMLAVRTAVRLTRAEPLRSQLCRSPDGLQYRLTLLRRDGRVVRVTLNAVDGVLIASQLPPQRRLKALEPDRLKPTVAERHRPALNHGRLEADSRPKAENAVRPKTAARKNERDSDHTAEKASGHVLAAPAAGSSVDLSLHPHATQAAAPVSPAKQPGD